MNTIYENLVKACPTFLDELKLRCIENVYDPIAFGNSFTVLKNDELRFRIIRDRGQIFGEIAPPFDPDNWSDLDEVLRTMGFEPERAIRKWELEEEREELDNLCHLVVVNYEHLVSMFSKSNFQATKHTLENLQNIRAKRLFGENFSG